MKDFPLTVHIVLNYMHNASDYTHAGCVKTAQNKKSRFLQINGGIKNQRSWFLVPSNCERLNVEVSLNNRRILFCTHAESPSENQ